MPISTERPRNVPLYRSVADRIQHLIDGGTLLPGERIPSIRKLSSQLAVSVNTVLEAYRCLEDQRVIEARPQSGYYVRCRSEPPEPEKTESCASSSSLDMGELSVRLVTEASRPDVVRLGAAIPSPELFPSRALNRSLARMVRKHPEASVSYSESNGIEALRVQVARRMIDAGCSVAPGEIVITAGAQEAVYLALRAVTRPGDTVLIESPTYHILLQTIESLHLRALEIATDPRLGVCVDEVEKAIGRQRIAACVLIPTHGNPLGHCMPESARRSLVELLDDAGIPLIEDDVYGELPFAPKRGKALKAYDRSGNVIYCSSFSKVLAPGYRVGWSVPGRHLKAFELLKLSTSVAAASPMQLAVADFLESGGFDRSLRRLRRTFRDHVTKMSAAVAEHFPEGTRLSRPQGGHVLWVELPERVDSLELHEEALRHGLSVAPGVLFSATGRYRNFIRLNCAITWTPRVEQAIETLGRLVG